LVVAVIATSFTSCKSEEEKMAEKSFDHYEKYMDSVNTIVEAEASANWQAIEAGYNDRISEAYMALIRMEDQTNAEDRLERTKAKCTEFKIKVEANAPEPVSRKTEIRNTFFGGSIKRVQI